MYLVLDPSTTDTLGIALIDPHGSIFYSSSMRISNRSMLEQIESVLQEQKVLVTEIKGIAVVQGVGSFSSSRLSATIAQVWGFVASIQVRSLSSWSDDQAQALIQLFDDTTEHANMHVLYSGDPHIGAPRI